MMTNLMTVFKDQAKKYPQRTAIISGTQQLSYAELDNASHHLAIQLSESGVSRGDIVPLLMTPSLELIISVFALHKIGAAYLPIALDAPRARKELALSNSGSKIVLTNLEHMIVPTDLLIFLVSINDLDLKSERALPPLGHDDSLAYVIFTSGSTGVPKGVKITQSNLSAMMASLQKVCPCVEGDSYLLSTPYSFDVSVSEIFGWILGGASLVISPFESTKRMESTLSLFENLPVTHAAFTPSVFHSMLRVATSQQKTSMNAKLKYCMLAGEALSVRFAHELKRTLPDPNIVNLYGPTETTIYATSFSLNAGEWGAGEITVPIGQALDGVECLIVDEQGSPADEGELFLGGAGVSLGYLHDEEKTAAAFVKLAQGRFYKTGDLVKLVQNQLVFLGRRDHQVKINGIRVELSEIEFHMSAVNSGHACVIYSDKKLLGFVPSLGGMSEEAWIKQLRQTLPGYMIPGRILEVGQWPITGNGKTDRHALLNFWNQENSDSTFIGNEKIVDCKTQRVADLFSEVLGASRSVRSDSNFFSLGGDSLANVTLLSLLEREYNTSLPFDFLRSHRTPLAIARALALETRNVVACVDTLRNMTISEFEIVIEDALKAQKGVWQELSLATAETQVEECYAASNFQRSYMNFGFASILAVEINTEPEHGIDKIQNALNKLMQLTDFLRMRLDKIGDDVIVETYAAFDLPLFPVHDLRHISEEDANRVRERLWHDSVRSIDIRIPKSPLFDVHLFGLKNGKHQVKFLLHHAIADANSLPILQELFHRVIQDEIVEQAPRLKNYLETLRSATDPETLCSHPYTALLEKTLGECHASFTGTIFDTAHVTFQVASSVSAEERLMLSTALITEAACKKYALESVVFQTLLDFRTPKGTDFSRLVGDCHIGVTGVRKRAQNNTNFMNHFSLFFEEFHVSTGLNVSELVFGTFPNLTSAQKRLLAAYESAPIKINYVGEKSKAEAAEIIRNSEETRKSLSKMRKQVRFQCFTVNDTLHILQLNTL